MAYAKLGLLLRGANSYLSPSRPWGKCSGEGDPRWEPPCDCTSLLLGDFQFMVAHLGPQLTFILQWVQIMVIYFLGRNPVLEMETVCSRSSDIGP